MGKKPARKRKYFFLYLTGVVITLFVFLGCMGKDSSYYAKKRIESVLETEGDRSLAFARSFMDRGFYNESLEKSEAVLAQYPRSLGDQALLNIGLVYAHPAYSEADAQKSIEYFQRLIEEYPESILKVEAEIWILILQDRVLKNQELSKSTQKLEALEKDSREKITRIQKMQHKIDNLQDQVKELKSQIDRLKNVDIGIEEKKRKSISE